LIIIAETHVNVKASSATRQRALGAHRQIIDLNT